MVQGLTNSMPVIAHQCTYKCHCGVSLSKAGCSKDHDIIIGMYKFVKLIELVCVGGCVCVCVSVCVCVCVMVGIPPPRS